MLFPFLKNNYINLIKAKGRKKKKKLIRDLISYLASPAKKNSITSIK